MPLKLKRRAQDSNPQDPLKGRQISSLLPYQVRLALRSKKPLPHLLTLNLLMSLTKSTVAMGTSIDVDLFKMLVKICWQNE